MKKPQYKLGSKVCLIKTPSKVGRVVEEPRGYAGGFEYLVAINGTESWYAEFTLASYESEAAIQWKKYDHFLCELLISKLDNPLSDSLYSYGASRTEFAAYQFRPALKFLNNPDQRILIADEVGLGKTIEASIIYLELKARLDISKILVLCPSRLMQKWQDELSGRFEESFTVLDSNGVRRLLADYKRTNGTAPFRAIASFETLRREDMREAIMQAEVKLDLLIVDEAHHMRNQETSTHKIGAILTDTADAAIYLTATPLHLGNDDLYNLLYLLSPGDFNDRNLFGDIVEPNKYINAAIKSLATGDQSLALSYLIMVEKTRIRRRFTGNPYYNNLKERLTESELSREDKIYLQRDLMELNTLSSVITRTRKREVSHAAVRAAFAVEVELTQEESAFYNAILEQVRQNLRSQGYSAISFAMVMRERMAASCLVAMKQYYQDTKLHDDVDIEFEANIYDSDIDDDMYNSTREQSSRVLNVEGLLKLADRIGRTDSKFDSFLKIIEEVHADTPDSKILVFSSFRRTLAYLQRQLWDRGYKISVIHGDVKMADRQGIIDNFKENPKFKIMLSSEVGAEGLDFQFCDVLINYDLPWNPMKVEQRIGRLDRFGQTHDRIRIYNFYIKDTIETRILQRLYDRINIFLESIGDLEAILGEQIKVLSREVLQAHLTPEEEMRKANEAADVIIQRQRANEEFEKQKDEFLGQDAILNSQVERTINNGRVIHSEEVRAAVKLFIEEQFPRSEFIKDEEEPTWSLRCSANLAVELQKYRHNSSRKLLFSDRFWERLINSQIVPLTFDSDYARQRPLLEFVTYNHLLADAAMDYVRSKTRNALPGLRSLIINGREDEAGDGYFFVYALNEEGLQHRRVLKTVVVSDDGRVLPHASETVLGQLYTPVEETRLERDDSELANIQQHADSWIAYFRDQRLAEISRKNEALIISRTTALEQSYEAKIRRAEETLDKVENKSIKKLYRGQIRNLQVQLANKIQELESSVNVNVSYSLKAVGRVRILPILAVQHEEDILSDVEIADVVSEEVVSIRSVHEFDGLSSLDSGVEIVGVIDDVPFEDDVSSDSLVEIEEELVLESQDITIPVTVIRAETTKDSTGHNTNHSKNDIDEQASDKPEQEKSVLKRIRNLFRRKHD